MDIYYTIEEVKEDIIVPGDEVYIIKAKWVPDSEDEDEMYENFILPRNKEMLQKIIGESLSPPYWLPDRYKEFRGSKVTYVDGTYLSANIHKWLTIKHPETFHRCGDNLMQKIYNSIVLNQASASLNDYNWPYYIYAFNRNGKYFVIRAINNLSPEECYFDEYVYILAFLKHIRNRYNETIADFFKERIKHFMPITSEEYKIEYNILVDIAYEYAEGKYYYKHLFADKIKMDIVELKLNEHNIDLNATTIDERHW